MYVMGKGINILFTSLTAYIGQLDPENNHKQVRNKTLDLLLL
jgi:hypothetical protein